MTIALNNSSPIQYPGNGSTVTFSYPWKISAQTDLVVGFVVGGIYTQQTSGYTVSGIGLNQGGSITFNTAPGLGTTIDLRPLTPETQGTEFANLAAYLPESSTNTMDRIVRMIQDLTRLTYTFGVHGPDQEFNAWPALPQASVRANTGLVFDENGLPNVGILTSSPLTQTLFNAFLASVPTPSNTAVLGSPANTYANAYFGPNGSPVFDPITGNIGFYGRTAAEITASVIPTNYTYLPGDVRRYGAVGDGVSDDTAALLRATSINAPIYIPYTPGNGYKITATITFTQNVICDGQLYAVGIKSNIDSFNNPQPSGFYTATNPAVIIAGNLNYVRGLFVEGDGSAKANNTIAIRVDGNSHTLDRCGASNCGWGCVVNGFIMQFTNCYFTFNNTNMTMWGASFSTALNSVIVSGGSYGGATNFALNIGDIRFLSSAGSGGQRGAAIRLEGFNCDAAPVQIDDVVAVSARNVYFEYTSTGTSGFILGGSGANNLRGCDIDSCFFNNMKIAIQCLSSVAGLKVGRANFYTGVTISAVKFSDMTQGAHYESGANSGSFANGQEVGYNFPGQSIASLNFGGITNERDGLTNGVQIIPAPASGKWYPGGIVVAASANTRTVAVSSAAGVYYTVPTTNKSGNLSGNQLTMAVKSDSYFFNGGDRLIGAGSATGVAICLGVDYDNGIVMLDINGSGLGTISQVTVTTATETIP